MNPEQRRALELLAQSPRGCTEDMMMVAHKFEIDVLAKLIGNGLATATTESVRTGGRMVDVVRLQITEDGRRALAGEPSSAARRPQ
jgi:hypothetical protein